jgi:LysM repeat protein
VIKGDTPYNISKKYGISVDDLLKMNPKFKDGRLAIGSVLTVKSAAATPSAPKTGAIVILPKQTVYGITKQFHITEADLRKLNPDLDAHMKIGDQIILPSENIKKYGGVQQAVTPVSAPVENQSASVASGNKTKVDAGNDRSLRNVSSENGDEYATYTVEAGDTVFSIVNKYGITIDELLALNPELAKGLKTGMVLKIRKLDPAYVKKNGDALNVVLMLPLGTVQTKRSTEAWPSIFLPEQNSRLKEMPKTDRNLTLKL